MRVRPVATLALALLACSGPSRPPTERARSEAIDAGLAPAPSEEPEPADPFPDDLAAPDGAPCRAGDTCAGALQCRGPSGCQSAWACAEPRECGAEAIAYCDCNGMTFYAPAGCPGRSYSHRGPCESVGELIASGQELGVPDYDEPIVQDARVCSSSADCDRWRVCWGVPGCATNWSCVRARGCRRDSVPFCGCDGMTFRASSNCPGRPYVYRGECREQMARAGEPGAGNLAVPESAPRPAPSPPPGVPSEPSQPPDAEPSPAIESAPAQPVEPAIPPAPNGCASSRDCRRGEVCQGEAGCGEEIVWRCARPERECVRDTQVFCACDGRDFRASMFCPGRPYRHRGSCEIDRLMDLSGAAVR